MDLLKYVVLGAMGQLGRDLCSRLPGAVVGLTRQQADLTRPQQLAETLAALQPGVVLNCAAHNLVDRAETEPEAAFAVNTLGVRNLARQCAHLDCTLVHFSTDHVFGLDDERRTPYTEADAPGPVSVYGLSKLAGEQAVRALCPRHFVIRTCGLYGAHGQGGKGTNFVETMLRRAAQNLPLRVVADQFCTPTTTADLAAAVADLVCTERFGLYHLTNSECCSWYEFALTIFNRLGLKPDLTPVTSRQYGAAARRPSYSVLATNRNQVPALRPWRQALAAYLVERQRLLPVSRPAA
jgi:dTDP-4-dehydrorhamnose reductase